VRASAGRDAGHGLNSLEKWEELAGAAGGVGVGVAAVLDALVDDEVEAARACGVGSLASGVNGDDVARAFLACSFSRWMRVLSPVFRFVVAECTEVSVRVALPGSCERLSRSPWNFEVAIR
jgi:hypothetical protein